MNALRACPVLLLVMIALRAFAQDPIPSRIEYGKVSKAELAMKSFPADTNAEAVSLCDYGVCSFTDGMGLRFVHHERIKIFTKAGFSWGTVRVPLYTEDHYESLGEIEAATYLANPDGTIKRVPLAQDAIFKEDTDKNHTRYSFTLPVLEPGCVIEYRIVTIRNNIYHPPEWDFQKSIPVVWSEYRLIFPNVTNYAMLSSGFQTYTIQETFTEDQSFNGETSTFIGAKLNHCTGIRLVLRDAPAVREEPFITTTSDYCNHVAFQLSEYLEHFAGTVKKVLKTWEMVLEEFLDADDIARSVEQTSDVRRATEKAIAGATTEEEKVRRVYDDVRGRIEWDGLHQWSTTKSVNDVLESRTGNSAEITALLVSMLQAAGIQSCQAILSTRSNGKLHMEYPMLTQFNYALACATIDGKRVFLDATDRFRPMELLSPEVLNTRCLLIRKGPVEWADLTTAAAFDDSFAGTYRLGSDGEIEGKFTMTDRDYASVVMHKRLKSGKPDEKVRTEIGADKAMLSVDTVSVQIPDSSSEVMTVSGMVASHSYAQAVGENLYVNPMVVGRFFENPLKRPTRNYPLDLAYPRKTTWQSRLIIPPGYTVKELPPDKSAAAALGDGYFKRTCTVSGDTLVTAAQYSLPRAMYDVEAYGRLREFLAQVTSIQSDQIVLEKKAATIQKTSEPAGNILSPAEKKGKKK
jgi:transglutaminase-like putative cysteine protease